MQQYPASIRKLVKQLSKLPGIGEKSAERLAVYILNSRYDDAKELAQSIIDVKDKVRLCSICFALSDDELCGICGNQSRDKGIICVVEQPADMAAIEKSGAFTGKYHILHGTLSPLDGIGPDDIKIKELISRVELGDITEIILATNTTIEGEATSSYIALRLKFYQLKVTRITSGVPIGGDLKYVDQITLKRAMETRYNLK